MDESLEGWPDSRCKNCSMRFFFCETKCSVTLRKSQNGAVVRGTYSQQQHHKCLILKLGDLCDESRWEEKLMHFTVEKA